MVRGKRENIMSNFDFYAHHDELDDTITQRIRRLEYKVKEADVYIANLERGRNYGNIDLDLDSAIDRRNKMFDEIIRLESALDDQNAL
jgi:hypothetical protein